MSLTFSEVADANARRQRDSFPTCRGWTLVDWSNALAGEVGEFCNKAKKLKRDGWTPELVDAAAKELADVIHYATLAALALGVDLEAYVRLKFNEVSVRVGSEVRL